jgi:hypothetical protein
MRRGLLNLALACAALGGAARADDTSLWPDAAGDAVIRRTDSANAGALNPLSRLPDVVSIRISGWQSPTPATDPYNGSVAPDPAHLMRLDVTFVGVINPPGPVTPGNHNPFRFGNSPVYGFIDLDVDRDRDTGGELGAAARPRFLANVGRFGWLPHEGSLGARGAVWWDQVDSDYTSLPQFERSGEDFALVLCGCFDPVVVSEGGNGNGVFDAGETWIVQGRFFQRAAGYQQASFAFGGSQAGLYDPLVKLRFSHSAATDRTTVSLVYALDGTGAGQLMGLPPQPVNSNVADASCVLEGLTDLVAGANELQLSGAVRDLAIRWQGKQAGDYLDCTRWRGTAIFGTAYQNEEDSAFVWTDTAIDEVRGDVNFDDLSNSADRLLVRGMIAAEDGGPRDSDGMVNGSVQLTVPGQNHFGVGDVTGDGRINALDSLYYCRPDINDDLILNVLDFNAFLNAFTSADPRADLDRNGTLNVLDFNAFLNAYTLGCP